VPILTAVTRTLLGFEDDPRSPTATFRFEESTSVIDRSELRFDLPNVMVWEGITFRPCE
jgi:hypothetical protein